jgi:hypothetical protein
MKNFIQDPLKVFLSVIGILFLTCLIFLSSCSSNTSQDTFEQAEASLSPTQIVNHSANPIILETLYKGNIGSGIYKVILNKHEKFIVVRTSSGVAIERIVNPHTTD